MKRSLVAVVLILVMLGSIGFGASAAEARAVQAAPVLTFDGTTANCKVTLTAVGKRNMLCFMYKYNFLI